eukprot:s1019_g5.t1
MFADCLHYQVDLLGGDANMAMYRATGRKQESVDIRGSMYQTLLDYFLEAWAKAPQSPYLCFPRVQHVSANSLCLLKQYEDLLGGQPYKDCDHPDRSTFPGLDPMVATVFEWGHSMDDEQWSMIPSAMQEFKVTVSECLLNSTSAAYLLNDRDYDSHTPLLIEDFCHDLSEIKGWLLPLGGKPSNNAAANQEILGEFYGIVKSYNAEKGFGFIVCDALRNQHDGDVYLHNRHVGDFKVGQEVKFQAYLHNGRLQGRDLQDEHH